MTELHVRKLHLDRGIPGGEPSPGRATVWNAALAPGAFAIVFMVAQLSDAIGIRVGFCASKMLLGIPCPGCGITTSVEALSRGNLAGALNANPAGPLVLLFAMVQLLLTAAATTHFLSAATIVRYSRLNEQILITVLLTAWLRRFF